MAEDRQQIENAPARRVRNGLVEIQGSPITGPANPDATLAFMQELRELKTSGKLPHRRRTRRAEVAASKNDGQHKSLRRRGNWQSS